MAFEIAKNFILNTTHIEFDESGVSYAVYSRTTNMINICVCRGIAVDRLTSVISIDSKFQNKRLIEELRLNERNIR